jgi:hypothetical protein
VGLYVVFSQEAEAAAEAAEAAGGVIAKAAAAAGVATGAAAAPTAANCTASSGCSDADVAEAADDASRPSAAAAEGAIPHAAAPTANGTADGAANGAAAAPEAAAANGTAAAGPSDAQQLAAEFEGFDEALIGSMLEDQGGDVKEVRFYLQVGSPTACCMPTSAGCRFCPCSCIFFCTVIMECCQGSAVVDGAGQPSFGGSLARL